MDDKTILGLLPADYPVGIGGCRIDDTPFDSCEYNVTVFDGKSLGDEIIKNKDRFIRISHGSLDESDSDVLIHYVPMRIINDPSWELQTLLSKVKDRSSNIFSSYAKNCILSSIFCCTRAKEGGIESNVFASCWQKSALIYLANSILALNNQRPTPSHGLEKLRNLGKTHITDKISVVHDVLGIERATPSLLDRMCKSTVGFSEQVEKNRHSLIIRAKHNYFVKNSMLADCYFYLICVNHANFVSIRHSIHRNPEFIHILKVAFDLEHNLEKLRQDVDLIQKSCGDIMSNMGKN